MNSLGPVSRLIDNFARLPGIGPKTAQRLAFYILSAPVTLAGDLASALLEARNKIQRCSVCCNLTDRDPCFICGDQNRSGEIICVVEQPRDVLALEKTRWFKGLYHVLHGAISPMNDIGPAHLTIKELLQRLGGKSIQEIILATNPNVEGDATALYLVRLLKPLGIKVTRPAHGLPVGASLEYADELTLSMALEGRKEMQ